MNKKPNPLPWQQAPLHDWAIVGMNHYFLNKKRHLFVAMIKGDRCIKAEGVDEEAVFADLLKQATQL